MSSWANVEGGPRARALRTNFHVNSRTKSGPWLAKVANMVSP
ncbi:hypothetical protein CCACVL1_28923 [Corchorus capsularis]|uniref:Uncharacterized protein n=1 Tax=Corchorus capsularis TaxID=210143 RepID=A0A1R3G4N7_COCAP|nr:hypothetical protein CCACVL1_28923 [Corchorus capsularis]